MNNTRISIPPAPSFHPPTSAAEPAPFVLLSDVPWAIYRHVCYCVRPCERHKEPGQATLFPVAAPGFLREMFKNMWLWYDKLEEFR